MRACSSSRYSLGPLLLEQPRQHVAHERVHATRPAPAPLAQRAPRKPSGACSARSDRARRAAAPRAGVDEHGAQLGLERLEQRLDVLLERVAGPGGAAGPRGEGDAERPAAGRASATAAPSSPSSATHSSRVNASSAVPIRSAGTSSGAAAPIATRRCGAAASTRTTSSAVPPAPAGRAARERLGVVEHDRQRRGQPLGELGGQRRAPRRAARTGSVAPASARGERVRGAGRRQPGSRRRCGRAAGPGRRRPAGSATHATAPPRARRRPRARSSCRRRPGRRASARRGRARPRAAGRAPGGPAASRRAQPARANPNPRRCSAVDLLELMARAPGAPAVLDALGAEPGVYVVGGAVRDALLGRVPRELDVVVEGDAVAGRPARRGAARRRRRGPRPLRHGRRCARRRRRSTSSPRARRPTRTRARCPTCGPARASRRTSRGATSPSTRSRCGSPTAR